MLVTLLGIVIVAKEEQSSITLFPICCSPTFKVIELRLVQFINALSSIVSTLLGIVMLSRLEQNSKAFLGIEETPVPIVMELRLLQREKVLLPSEVTLFGIVNDVRPDKAKALSPIVVTLSGILMLLRLVHESKVRSWIVIISPFIVIPVRAEQA